MHIRRSLGKRFDKKYVVATMKHPPSQIIWGAMSCRGATGLYFIPPNATMNGSQYVELYGLDKYITYLFLQLCPLLKKHSFIEMLYIALSCPIK